MMNDGCYAFCYSWRNAYSLLSDAISIFDIARARL
jgi:hypothetical protein